MAGRDDQGHCSSYSDCLILSLLQWVTFPGMQEFAASCTGIFGSPAKTAESLVVRCSLPDGAKEATYNVEARKKRIRIPQLGSLNVELVPYGLAGQNVLIKNILKNKERKKERHSSNSHLFTHSICGQCTTTPQCVRVDRNVRK